MAQEGSRKGQFHWGIKLSSERAIWADADDAQINAGGDLLLLNDIDTLNQKKQIVLAFAAGTWLRVWAASVMDGRPLAITEEIDDEDDEDEEE